MNEAVVQELSNSGISAFCARGKKKPNHQTLCSQNTKQWSDVYSLHQLNFVQKNIVGLNSVPVIQYGHWSL